MVSRASREGSAGCKMRDSQRIGWFPGPRLVHVALNWPIVGIGVKRQKVGTGRTTNATVDQLLETRSKMTLRRNSFRCFTYFKFAKDQLTLRKSERVFFSGALERSDSATIQSGSHEIILQQHISNPYHDWLEKKPWGEGAKESLGAISQVTSSKDWHWPNICWWIRLSTGHF